MIYKLTRTDYISYDEFREKVVRATSPYLARKIANEHVGEEGHIWANTSMVKCKRISEDGETCVISVDFNAG